MKVVAFAALGFLGFVGALAIAWFGIGLLLVIGPYFFWAAAAYLFVRGVVHKPSQVLNKKRIAADVDKKMLARMRLNFPGKFELEGDFIRLKHDFEVYSVLRERQKLLMTSLSKDIEIARLRLELGPGDFDYLRWHESLRSRFSDLPEKTKEFAGEIGLKMLSISSAYPPEVWDFFERLKDELGSPMGQSGGF